MTYSQLVKRSLNLFYSSSDVNDYHNFHNQVKYWIAITLLILTVTFIPAGCLSVLNGDIVEVAEGFLISLGIRAITAFSKLLIDNIFKIINESKLTYHVRGCKFFTEESPFEQYIAERSLRNEGRIEGVAERNNQVASNSFVWIILIICSGLVRFAPDVLAAGLISQTVPTRVPEKLNLTVPDLAAPTGQENLTLRGNCVWNRAGFDLTEKNKIDSFGFLIFQYCVDILKESEIDDPTRTLVGNLTFYNEANKQNETRQIHARFHLELFTKDFITEKWEPFEDPEAAQRVLDDLLKEENKCLTETCIEKYRQADDVLTYRLLTKVGLSDRRTTLKGDDESKELLEKAVGRVKHRLTPGTKAAFIVLIVTVVLFSFFHSISTSTEATHVLLYRAIGEIRNIPGSSFQTAIALPKACEDISRCWTREKEIPCLIQVGDEEDLDAFSPESFTIDKDESDNPYTFEINGKKFMKGKVTSSKYVFNTPKREVDNGHGTVA